METRTVLLWLHITAAAGWLGADLVVHAITPRINRDSVAAATAWARIQVWLHARYYAVDVVVLFVTGVLLVLDGDWSWGTEFIWVGIAAVVGGGVLGGGGLRSLAERRLTALEAGDAPAAAAADRGLLRLGIVVTALPVVAVFAMVEKWGL